MAHEILGNRFISRNRPAWHELGTLFGNDERLSAEEAVKRVAGDIDVRTFPVYFDIPNRTLIPTLSKDAAQELDPEENSEYEVGDQVVVVRMPTHDDPKPKTFGIVGKNWIPDPYHVLASALNKLSDTYRVETAGLLKNGSICFLTLKGTPWDVKGDPMESYFTATFSLKPGEGHRVIVTDVRTVCWNTMVAALAQSNITLRIKHGADAKQQIGLAGDLIVRFQEAQSKTKEMCEAFAAREVTVEECETVINAAFPEPTLPLKIQQFRNACGSTEAYEIWRQSTDPNMMASVAAAEERFEQLMKRTVELRSTAKAQYSKFEPTNMQGTLWAAYNACTEVSDWREGRGAAESSLFGNRATEKGHAFAAAVELLG